MLSKELFIRIKETTKKTAFNFLFVFLFQMDFFLFATDFLRYSLKLNGMESFELQTFSDRLQTGAEHNYDNDDSDEERADKSGYGPPLQMAFVYCLAAYLSAPPASSAQFKHPSI